MRFYENPQKTSENRLLPRGFYIPEGKSEYILLNGTWRFKFYNLDIDESYCDMCHASSVGMFSSDADKEYVQLITRILD
jgi:hypothetical protein